MAIQLAEAGASVTLLARNEEKLKAACAELNSTAGQDHGYLVADFSKPEALKIVVDNHVNSANPYHILLNNTGGPPGGSAVDAELDEFERAFRSHLMCNHVLVQALVDGMKVESYGRIINIISTSV